MEFKYYLSGIGGATCIVEVNGQKVEFTPSYLTDCLSDFLESLMFLNSNCVPKDELCTETECKWNGEPAQIEWTFELKENNRLIIKAVFYEDDFDLDNFETLMDTECLYDDFLRSVLKGIDELIKKHGIIGYKEQWYDCDFPLSTFLKLKNYTIYKQKYPLKEIRVVFDKEITSNLKYDLELLLQEIK